MSIRSSAAIKSARSHLIMIGLAAAISLFGATGVFAAPAEAATSFTQLDCGGTAGRVLVPVNQNAFCSARVSNIGGPAPTGTVSFTDSNGTGQFLPSNSCTLQAESSSAAHCQVTFRSSVVGIRTITARYGGDGSNSSSQGNYFVKVFIPGSTRFAKPGGAGPEPCTDKANPCSLFQAASTLAPATGVAPGQEVVLAPGTYTKADLGSLPGLTLEAGITFRGESGATRPLISTEAQISGINDKVSHIEIESKGSLAIETHESIVDEIVASTSAAGATTCTLDSGILRDSACLSTGTGAAAAGAGAFTEHGDSFAPRMRNVTAVSTGGGSFGVRVSLQSLESPAGQMNVDLGSVIAKGTRADVAAEAPQLSGPPGQVRVVIDHSDYASIEPRDPTANITITPPGDVSHGNITANPLLAGDNIHETFSSPTIDKGVLDGSSGGTIDIDGQARNQGAAPDIGADEMVPPNTTETKLTCNAPSLITGEMTKCTATVTDKANAAPARPFTGDTVSFKDNTQAGTFSPASCTLAALNSTQARCQTEVELKPTTIGKHALEASFATDGKGHLASTGPLQLEVLSKPNTTETKLTCKAPSLHVGESTSCTATVSDNADHNPASSLAGGIVTFNDGTQSGTFSPATCTLATVSSTQASCQAEVEFKPTTPATHQLEVSYPGDGGKHAPSAGTLAFEVKVQPNSTETKLTCNAPSLITGEATKCTATVSDTADHGSASSLAGGVLTFKDNTQPGAFSPNTCTLVSTGATQASCEAEVDFKPTAIASHSLEAVYPGDGENHAPSTGTLAFPVKSLPNTTETELTCKAPTLIAGEMTKCTATVSDNADHNPASSLAGGIVTFKDNTQAGAFSPTSCTLVAKGATRGACEVEVDFKPTTVAKHALEAGYGGDGGSHAPSSGTLSLQVNPQVLPNHTETKLSCVATSIAAGDTTKCTATVIDKADNGPATPAAGGLVSFKDNTEPTAFAQPATCQLATLNQAQAGCQVELDFKPTTVATHSLEATYGGDGALHLGSTGALSVQVKPQLNDTETKLTCKAAPLITGEATHCTATVTDKANHNPASSLGGGTVTFKDNTQGNVFNPTTCTLAVLTTTTATCQVEVEFRPTTVGNHALEASFAGDNAHASSVGPLTVQVKSPPNNTDTKLICKVPSLISGESTHCTATVTDKADNGAPSPPTGLVSFKDNTQAGTFTPASCQLQSTGANVSSCQAEVEFKPTTIANHQLEASVPADASHLGSSGNISFQVKVQPNSTETKLTCRAATLITGGATTCTATVTDNADHNPASSLAGGVVNFRDNTQANSFTPSACTLATISGTQASCQTEVEFKPTTVAGHALEATYPGDGDAHAGSVGAATVQVNAQPNDTETELTCKAATLITGESTTCTATVTDIANHNPASSLAGGTVSFKDATQPGAFLPPATCVLVSKGATRAGCQTEVELRPTAVADHELEAKYVGDGGNHAASSSPASTLEVTDVPPPPPHATATSLVCTPTSVVLGAGASQCTATVEDTAAGASHPSGEVKLELVSGEGTLAAGMCDLPDNGPARTSCQVIAFTPAKAGDHELKATYQGDAAHLQSSGTAKVTATAVSPPPPPPAPPAPPAPAAPNTILAKKPPRKTAARRATFKFRADQAGATFQCKLDRKAFRACRSPLRVKARPGRHTLKIRAINAQGVADPSPVVYRWTVATAKKRARH